MEKRANTISDSYLLQLKTDLKNKLATLPFPSGQEPLLNEFLEYMFSYPRLQFKREHFCNPAQLVEMKPEERCIAIRTNGVQCGRRKKKGEPQFCSSHCQGAPQGVIPNADYQEGMDTENNVIQQEPQPNHKDIFIQDFKGIVYYIDSMENVYKTEDILDNRITPRVIAHYKKDVEGNYTIPEFGLV